MEVVQLEAAFQMQSATLGERRRVVELFCKNTVAFRLKANRLEVEPHPGNFSIKTVFSGFERYTFANSQTTVRPGEVLFVKEDVMYSSAICSATETDSFALFMPRSLLRSRQPEGEAMQRFLDSGLGAVSLPGLNDVNRQLHRIAAALSAQDRLSAEEEMCALLEASGLASDELSELSENLTIANPRARAEVVRRVLLAREILHSRIDDGISLADLAQSVFMSEFHLMRCFRRCFGVSVAQYLTRLRMERAAQLLNDGRLSVTDVARRCGYSDLSAFGRAFRRHWRSSPSEMLSVDKAG